MWKRDTQVEPVGLDWSLHKEKTKLASDEHESYSTERGDDNGNQGQRDTRKLRAGNCLHLPV